MSKALDRIGETNTSFEGQLMTIIAYRNNKSIDVKFEDGVVVTDKSYTHFKNGTIKNPYKDALERIGEVNTATNGQKMTIIAYHSYDDIAVRFEDGTIVLNKCYKEFKSGNILNPCARTKESISRKGETAYSSKGELMTIKEYRGSGDIDIEFEDGTVVYNKTYNNFTLGLIANPNFSEAKYIGMTSTHKSSGQKMKIIAFRSCSDIDIKFEDGTIVYNKSVQNFKKGTINYKKLNREGESNVANNGLSMEIVKYDDNNSMKVKFEDGTLVPTSYSSFIKGNVAHPTLRLVRGGIFSKNSELNGFHIEKLSYRYNDESYYICKCSKCLYKDILSIREILEHTC